MVDILSELEIENISIIETLRSNRLFAIKYLDNETERNFRIRFPELKNCRIQRNHFHNLVIAKFLSEDDPEEEKIIRKLIKIYTRYCDLIERNDELRQRIVCNDVQFMFPLARILFEIYEGFYKISFEIDHETILVNTKFHRIQIFELENFDLKFNCKDLVIDISSLNLDYKTKRELYLKNKIKEGIMYIE